MLVTVTFLKKTYGLKKILLDSQLRSQFLTNAKEIESLNIGLQTDLAY